VLHRQAGTDLTAQLAYQDAVTAYHSDLRRFFYPYLFDDVRFGEADFAAQPRFAPPAATPAMPWASLVALGLIAAVAAGLGARAAGRVTVRDGT